MALVRLVAKQFGFTQPDDVDMDTTVQEAGITHPTEMKLMNHLMKRLSVLHGAIKSAGGRGIAGIKALAKEFKENLIHYRFFATDKVTKTELLHKAKALSEKALLALETYLPGQSAFDKLNMRYQEEILRFQSLGPQLVFGENTTKTILSCEAAKDPIKYA